MALDDATLETWTYAGKWIREGRLRDRWVEPGGKDLLYPSLKADVIGGLYTIKADRSNGGITVYGKPEWLGTRMDDHTKMTEYIVEDMSQRTKHAILRREIREGKQGNPLDAALEPLLHYARACTTRQDKDALIATVLRKMTDAW